MVALAPALYVGTVRHRRFAPRAHQFRYGLQMAFLDVDRLADAMAVSRLTSYNRWNWASYHEHDHLGDPRLPLRDRLRDSAAAAGETLPDGPVYLLTHLRYGGYVFNPISIFYCYDRGGAVTVALAEVSNTYGGRRHYWLRPVDDAGGRFRAMTPKSLYVSPFLPPDLTYEFVLMPPGPGLVAHMNVRERRDEAAAGVVLDATLTLRRHPWTARSVRRALLRFPLMTTKVIAAIHWQALRLRLKGLPRFAQTLGSVMTASHDRPLGRAGVPARGGEPAAWPARRSSCRPARARSATPRARPPACACITRDSSGARCLAERSGFGESYLDADWSTPDLVALLRLMLANLESMPSWPGLTTAARLREAVAGRLGRNTRARSRHNVCAHYDLGNEFFKLFLDANLLYSCALFERSDDTLEVAQINKLRAICDALDLTPRDHVLEIGTGWGGFAVFAATRYGCRVTTTTISREQHAYAERLIAQSGVGARITLRAEDYRDLRGRFDKICQHRDVRSGRPAALRRLLRRLRPAPRARRRPVPANDYRGRLAVPRLSPDANLDRPPHLSRAELASVAEILASLARVTRLRLHEVRQIGAHYARTIHHWRARFHTRLDEARTLGFNDRFLRMWDVYLTLL